MAVGKGKLSRHLLERHTVPPGEKKTLLEALKPQPIMETEASFPTPADHSEPVRGLEIHEAFKCNVSDCKYITRNADMIKRHYRDHQRCDRVTESASHDSNMEQRWERVRVQQWRAGSGKHGYWIVKADHVDVRAVLNARGTGGANEDYSMEGLSFEDRMMRMEAARLSKQDRDQMAMTESKCADDTSPWLLRNKWPETFARKSLRLIGRTRYSDMDPQTKTMFPDPISGVNLRRFTGVR